MPTTAPPAPLSQLLDAIHAGDVAGIRAAFAPDSEIHDEGETLRGAAGAERWAERVLGYRLTMTVEDVASDGDERVVTMSVAGAFPGSPTPFAWRLTTADDRIATLRIRPA